MKKRFSVIAAVMLVLILALLTSCGVSSNGGVDSSEDLSPDYSGGYASGTIGTYSDQKMIRNARISAETKDFEKMTTDLRALMKETGAVLYSSDVNDGVSYGSYSDATAYASYTIKVPSDKLDDFTDSLRQIMNVTRMTSSTQNASEEYYDIEAQVKTLENKYAGLSEMLKNTDKTLDFETWLKINNELTSVEKELAKSRAQFDAISKQVNYATVELSVTEIDKLTGEEDKPFGQEITDAFKGSFEVFTDIMKALVIVAIYVLPFLIPMALFAGVVLLVVLLVLRSSRKKKKTKTE
mgnify:FL=1